MGWFGKDKKEKETYEEEGKKIKKKVKSRKQQQQDIMNELFDEGTPRHSQRNK